MLAARRCIRRAHCPTGDEPLKKRDEKTLAGRIFMLVALIGLTVIVVSRFTDFRHFVDTLANGDWRWISVGIAIHIVYFVAYAYLYHLAFSAVGVESRTRKLLPVLFAGIFVNAVVPSGGAGAAALFIDDAARRRQSPGRAAAAVVLVLLADLVTLVPFIVWGFVFLARRRILAAYDALGAGLFTAYVLLLAVVLVLANRSPRRLQRMLDWVRRMVDRVGKKFHKPDLISEDWPKRTADEFCEAARTLVKHPAKLLILGGWGVVLHVINVVGIWALLRAFRVDVPVSGQIAAFGMGIVFFVITVIPEGVAIVETVMTLVFRDLGVAKQKAITVTLVFRGANFWLPLLIGIWFLWRLRHFGQRASGDE